MFCLGRRLEKAQVRRPVRGVLNRFHVPRGTKEPSCRFHFLAPRAPAASSVHLCASIHRLHLTCTSAPPPPSAATSPIPPAPKLPAPACSLLSNGTVVAISSLHARRQLPDHYRLRGRFFLVVAANSFRQLQTPDFYAGQFDSIERNVVLEPAWVRESIVVTATGTPTPAAANQCRHHVLGPLDLLAQTDLVESAALGARHIRRAIRPARRGHVAVRPRRQLRMPTKYCSMASMPAISAVNLISASSPPQRSKRRSLSRARFQSLRRRCSQRRRQSHHAARHHQLSLTTFPGRRWKLPYFARRAPDLPARTRGSTTSAHPVGCRPPTTLPNDEYHLGTGAANLGWAPNATTQIRGTVHYGVDATGVPNAWDFYHVADNATQKDQDIYRQRLHRQPDHGRLSQRCPLRINAQARTDAICGSVRNSGSPTRTIVSAPVLSAIP